MARLLWYLDPSSPHQTEKKKKKKKKKNVIKVGPSLTKLLDPRMCHHPSCVNVARSNTHQNTFCSDTNDWSRGGRVCGNRDDLK